MLRVSVVKVVKVFGMSSMLVIEMIVNEMRLVVCRSWCFLLVKVEVVSRIVEYG